jgi:two-component system cell cycle response regulator
MGHMDDAGATLDRCIQLCASRGMIASRVEALEERACLYAAQGLFQRAYEQHIEFHAEDATLRAAQREANARTLQAVFETTEARREGERFRQLSLRDALTGLRNRRHVDTELPVLLARSREDGSSLSVGLVDLDHFKLVNDRFSHAVGDKVLVRVSGILAAATAESGWAARMGGEEFLLVFPAVSEDEALRRCEDVRRAIESVMWDGAMAGETVTVSVGFTVLQRGRTSQAALLGQADRNLYAAKHQGRNRVVSDVIG